jgi:hypothetical protein
MSIEKHTLTGLVHEDKKLTKLYTALNKTYDDLIIEAPEQSATVGKYDLVARNVQEALLLLSFRNRQYERVAKFYGKLSKVVRKI